MLFMRLGRKAPSLRPRERKRDDVKVYHAHGTKIPKRYYCYCNKIEYLDDEIKGKSEYMVKDKIAAEQEARGRVYGS